MRALLLALYLAAASAWLPAADKAKASDDSIYDHVRQKLAVDPQVQGGAFDVTVKDGVVTIKGVVEREKYKEKAERLVKKVKGVTGVDNQLRIGPRGSK